MRRCIEIAKNGLGTTAPNPMVGCVLVHNERIIGEGFTSPYGGAHAEVNAINSVYDKYKLKEATMYVSLEPCSHFGKTPPCADLIIENKIPKVIIGLLDPHEKVSGKGIEKLKASGCEVVTGVLENECRRHHKRFLTYHEKKRPYIILKWAQTIDGFIAPEKGRRQVQPEPYWITNSSSRQLVHKWRSEEQAILVGTTTVLEDNPKLNVRSWSGKNPIRIVLDRNLKLTGGYEVLKDKLPTLVFTEVNDPNRYLPYIEYKVIDFSKNLASQITTALFKKNLTSVLIEGGSKTLQTFIDTNLWDEARIFTGQSSFKRGIESPVFSGKFINSNCIGTDVLKTYMND